MQPVSCHSLSICLQSVKNALHLSSLCLLITSTDADLDAGQVREAILVEADKLHELLHLLDLYWPKCAWARKLEPSRVIYEPNLEQVFS